MDFVRGYGVSADKVNSRFGSAETPSYLQRIFSMQTSLSESDGVGIFHSEWIANFERGIRFEKILEPRFEEHTEKQFSVVLE